MQVIERESPDDADIRLNIHPLIKKIYAARGLTRDADIQLRLQDLEPPARLKNIDDAVALLEAVLRHGERILIVGDFDADGATSSALGVLCLRAMGCAHVDYLVPNRFEYGYGLTPEIVEVARERRPDLILTVDNGIASHAGVDLARQCGIKVLVTDHHLPGDTLPAADCILNPNLPGCEFPSKALAGVGVVFYLMSALRARLREQDWFRERGIPEPNMGAFLDIVALGTVADVVPLDQNNRRLVKHGLNIIRGGRGRPGILALLEVANRNHRSVVASDLGFAAGPRLNAAGRLDDMSLGIECLLAEDPVQAQAMARQLDDLNRDRKHIEEDMRRQAMAALGELALDDDAASRLGICLYDAQWHQGVIGILASRIKERFHRPVIVFADAGEDEAGESWIKGSARSIPGLHIRDLLDAVATRNPEILSKFGGHAMAAGLSLRLRDYEAFRTALERELARAVHPAILQRKTYVDGCLTPDCFDLEFAHQLREAGPWGQNFPEPLFRGEFQVVEHRILSERHLKLVLQVPEAGSLIDGIAFNLDHADIEPWREGVPVERVSLIYRLDVNEYRGNCAPQLMIEKLVLTSGDDA